jgi:signal transduction histidine kinase
VSSGEEEDARALRAIQNTENLRDEISKLEAQAEIFAHNIQVNIQGIITDAEVLLRALEQGRFELARKDGKDLIEKVIFLFITSNNIRPNLGDYEFARLSIGQMVETGIENFSSMGRDRGIVVSFDNRFAEGGPFAEVSRNHFQQAFHNILHNAIKYSYTRQGRPRTIDVLLRPYTSDYLLLKVVNYGVPIDEDEVPRLIENGYRGRHSQERFRTGGGRGLFIAHSVVEQHHGTLEIRSKTVSGGAGVTVVSIYLPYRQLQGEQNEKNSMA